MPACRANLHLGIDQARGPDHLLDHDASRVFEFVGRRGRRDVDALKRAFLPLVEGQGAVVQGRRKPPTELHQCLLARPIPPGHTANLGNADMALVHHEKSVVGKIVIEGKRRLPGGSPIEPTRVVLDPVTEAQLFEHLDIVHRAGFQALGLKQFARFLKLDQALVQFFPYSFYRLLKTFGSGHIMAGRIDHGPTGTRHHFAPERIDLRNRIDFVAKELHPNCAIAFVLGEDLHHVAAHPESSTMEIVVVSGVEHVHELTQEILPHQAHPRLQIEVHGPVVLGRTQAVNA